ncbi:hypothetical protein Tco_1392900 [Tanacetum coccineum]
MLSQNVGNQNGVIVVPGIAHQNGNGNVVVALAKGNANGNNGNQIRCYNCRGLGHLARNYTVKPRRRDAAYLQTQLLIAQKEEAGIQLQAEEFDLMAAAADLDEIKEVNANCILMANLQQASTSGTQTDKAPIYDSDRSAEVIQICLWYVNSGCSKHMTGNLKLLINFVWKFLGTVRFGNDHVAAILGFNLENDREDIGKLGAKAMAFEQSNLEPGLQSLTSGQISSGLDFPFAPSTITTQRPTEGELDLLFESMYDDHIGG